LFQERRIAGTADEQTALARLGDALHNIITLLISLYHIINYFVCLAVGTVYKKIYTNHIME